MTPIQKKALQFINKGASVIANGGRFGQLATGKESMRVSLSVLNRLEQQGYITQDTAFPHDFIITKEGTKKIKNREKI